MTDVDFEITRVPQVTDIVLTVEAPAISLPEPELVERRLETMGIVIDCPSCGRPIPYPGDTDHGLPMAECDRCDIYFNYDLKDLYAFTTPSDSAA